VTYGTVAHAHGSRNVRSMPPDQVAGSLRTPLQDRDRWRDGTVHEVTAGSPRLLELYATAR